MVCCEHQSYGKDGQANRTAARPLMVIQSLDTGSSTLRGTLKGLCWAIVSLASRCNCRASRLVGTFVKTLTASEATACMDAANQPLCPE